MAGTHFSPLHLIRPDNAEYSRHVETMTSRARRAAQAECAAKKNFSDYDAVFHAKFAAVQRGEL